MYQRGALGNLSYLLILLTVTLGAIILHMHSDEAFGQECTPTPPGLISWWTANGDANDHSSENHGTLQNGALFASGIVDQAFLLDGIDDYVNVPPDKNLDIENAITIDAWIKPTKGGVTILDKTGFGDSANYRFFLGLADLPTDSRLGFWNGSKYVIGTNSIPINQFSHVAITLLPDSGIDARSILKIYINGELDSIHSTEFGPTNNGPLRIGSDIIGRYFEGIIDEVGIFNRELSQSEIQNIYNAGPMGKCPPILGFFGPLEKP